MKNNIIVIGAGGHAKVVIELLKMGGFQIDYCVGGLDSPDYCLGIPVLKGDEHLHQLAQKGYCLAFIAIGKNALRERLARHITEIGYTLVNAISTHAILSPSVEMGKGIAVMSGAIINAESAIDDLAIINTGAVIDHDCKIGYAAHVGPQSGLAGNVQVGKRSFLGIGATVIPEMRIGDDAIVAAGSVVTSHVPDQVLVAGVPAKIIEKKERV